MIVGGEKILAPGHEVGGAVPGGVDGSALPGRLKIGCAVILL
jgi:hypothetical protein